MGRYQNQSRRKVGHENEGQSWMSQNEYRTDELFSEAWGAEQADFLAFLVDSPDQADLLAWPCTDPVSANALVYLTRNAVEAGCRVFLVDSAVNAQTFLYILNPQASRER